MATVSTLIALRKHGLMLRERVIMKEGTWSASAMWRTKALSSLNLDTVRENKKIKMLYCVESSINNHSLSCAEMKMTDPGTFFFMISSVDDGLNSFPINAADANGANSTNSVNNSNSVDRANSVDLRGNRRVGGRTA